MDELKNAAKLLDRGTLVCERPFPVAPEELWEVIATRKGLSHWFLPPKNEIKQGGRFAFEGGWEGTVTRVLPPRLIHFTPDGSSSAYLRFEISETGQGCIFKLTDRMDPNRKASEISPEAPEHQIYQPGGPGTHWSGLLAGYHGFVDELERYLTGKQPEAGYDELCRGYMVTLDQWHGGKSGT